MPDMTPIPGVAIGPRASLPATPVTGITAPTNTLAGNTSALNLSPHVMNMSPSLYAAAATGGLNANQQNMVNQIAGTVQTYKALNALPIQQAKQNYKALGQEAQAMLKSMYGAPAWTNTDNWITGAVKGIASTTIKAVASPLIALYQAAGIESKVINAPYLFARELTQGESAFNFNTYKKAWNGNAVFDNGTLANLQKTYGKANAFIAEGILKGETPGQIIDSYGKVDGDLYTGLANMLGNTKEFNSMMDEFRGAQVSPGRDLARLAFNVPITDSHFYTTGKWKYSSGTVDAFYEILHDPLTYITGGGAKVAEASTKGAQMAEKLIADPALRASNAEEIFKPGTQLANTWDNTLGPLVQRATEADKAKDPVAKAAVMRDIAQNAPEINNPDFLSILGKAKAFDANGIKEFAKTMQGAQELHMGTIDGPTALRMGIPVARRERFSISGANRVLSDLFNGKITEEQVDNALKNGHKGLEEIGRALDPVTGLPTTEYDRARLDSFQGQMTLGRRISRMAQTHPGHEVINVMDENVKSTLSVFNRYLRLAGYPKYAADITTAAFEYSNPTDRVTVLRGLYSQIMNLMGVPEESRAAVLSDKFADSATFANPKDLYINPEHLSEWKQVDPLVHDPLKDGTDMYKVTTNGPLHAYQGKPHIGGLDFNGPELAPYGFNFAKTKPAYLINHVLGNATRSAFARKITNLWATGSIFPRMGTRGTVEQGIFHLLTAPVQNITGWARGRALNRLGIALTGNNEQMPIITRGLKSMFGINPAKWIPEKSVYDQMDKKIVQGHLDRGIVNGQEVWQAAQHADLIHALAAKIDRYSGGDPVKAQILEKFLKYPTGIRSAEVNSVIAKSAMAQGIMGGELDQSVLTGNQIQRMLKSVGYKATGRLKNVDPAQIANDLGEDGLADSHFRVWAPMFKSFNKLDGFHFGENFIKNNALKTGADFAAARDAILKRFGMDPETLEIVKPAEFKKYKQFSMQTARDVSDKGLTEAQSVLNRVQIALQDMYTTFHGDPIKYNDKLVKAVQDIASAPGGSIAKGLDAIDHNAFRELTRDFRPTGEFKSDLEPLHDSLWNKSKEEVGGEIMNAIKRFGDGGLQGKALGMMDAQINYMFNQPALRIAAMTLNEKYLPLEKEMYNKLIEEGYAKETAKEISERHFVEVAEKNAAQQVLKFVDSAAKQSNLAFALKTSGRFYRAQEQFQRRIMRLKDYLPRALYRTRLAHLGIDNAGFIHKDQNGNPYISVPGDAAMFNAINGTLNFFLNRPDTAVSTPLFANFNMNLIQSSPSLGPDAGVPAFSGPLMSVPILGLKMLLNKLPWGFGKDAATSIDSVMLGSKNANLTASKLEPVFVQRMIELLPKDEQDHQYASAAMMAISFNALHGYGDLTPSSTAGMSTDEYKSKAQTYLDNLHVTVNNVIGLRALLGMISPIAPTLAEGKDVPNVFKNVGINNFSAAFNDILQGVLRNDKGLSDPYETALGIFTEKNPGMSVFAIGKNDKQTKLLQSYTQNTQSWMLNNSKWVNNSDPGIASAAMIFAPDMGKYDPNTYTWMQSTGLITQKPLAKYLQDVMTAQDVAAYWNAKNRETNALRIQGTDRAGVIADAQAEQQSILTANPVVALTVGDAKTQLAKYQNAFAGLGALLSRKDFPIPDAMRKKMQVVYNYASNAIQSMTVDTTANGFINASVDKEKMKQDAIDQISSIGGATKPGDAPTDPQVAEALKSIIVPLLDNLSKTTVKAGLTK